MAATRFLYDGTDLIAEYNTSGTLQRRFVHGPQTDQPLVWYEGSGTSDRRWLVTDERGSVIAVTDDAGDPIAINTYDEYGQPDANNVGRFQYTGQAWIEAAGLYYYKTRFCAPAHGRDNVFVERLWRSVKYEEVYLHAYYTVSDARDGLGKYFTVYNGRRPHSSLKRKTPDQVYYFQQPLTLAA